MSHCDGWRKLRVSRRRLLTAIGLSGLVHVVGACGSRGQPQPEAPISTEARRATAVPTAGIGGLGRGEIGVTIPSPVAAGSAVRIRVNGSEAMRVLTQAWIDSYRAANESVAFALTATGSVIGLVALIQGNADLATSSRPMTADEKARALQRGAAIEEAVVARDGVAIIVHPTNTAESVDLGQLADLLHGDMGNWRGVNGPDLPVRLIAVNRVQKSGTHEYLRDHVIRAKHGPQSDWASHQNVGSLAEALEQVALNAGALSYASHATLDSPAVKAVRVAAEPGSEAILPTSETVAAGTYPLSRPLYVYYRSDAPEELKAFVQWISGPEGQSLVAEAGLVPAAQ